jgi:hypothetical protein
LNTPPWESSGAPIDHEETPGFTPLPGGGTRVISLTVMYLPLPRWLRKLVAFFMLALIYRYDRGLAAAGRLAGGEFTQSKQSMM